jgi:hypothetical protein
MEITQIMRIIHFKFDPILTTHNDSRGLWGAQGPQNEIGTKYLQDPY